MHRSLPIMSPMVPSKPPQPVTQRSFVHHSSHDLLLPARLGVINPFSEERAWVLGLHRRVTPARRCSWPRRSTPSPRKSNSVCDTVEP